MEHDLSRYKKQTLFTELSEDGQKKLLASRVLLCGCGALGSIIAEQLTRAGVGHLRIVDRDFVELSNLQRQQLFDENDVATQQPKAVAAANRLKQINSQVSLEPIVADITHENIRELCDGIHLILDGTDNFETRYLINDVSLELDIPWVNGGCVGSHGQVMPILPGETACLRCLMPEPPDHGSMETCDTAGVIGPAVSLVSSMQTTAAIQILTNSPALQRNKLQVVDIWRSDFRTINLDGLRESSNCPACLQGERLWLEGRTGSQTSVLCGRNAVQISPQSQSSISLDNMAEKLAEVGTVQRNPYLMRVSLNDSELNITLFPDGRAIIQGTDDATVARNTYAKYVGL